MRTKHFFSLLKNKWDKYVPPFSKGSNQNIEHIGINSQLTFNLIISIRERRNVLTNNTIDHKMSHISQFMRYINIDDERNK